MLHHGPIAAVAARGAYIATAGYDNQVILWDGANHQSLARSQHDHLVNHCAFNSDATLLASASSDYTARIWEVPSMRLKAALIGHTDDIDMAVFSPDDQLIATCALDRTIRVFDLTGRCLNIFTGHTGNIISVAWMRDGKRLVSCGVDGTVREWCMARERELRCHHINVRTDTLVIRDDGTIFAGDDEGRIVVIADGEIFYVQAHKAGIKKIEYDAVNQLLVTLSYDRTLALWKVSSPHTVKELSRSEFPALVWARSAAQIGPTKIAVGTFGSRYAIYDWQTNRWDTDGIVADRSLNAVTAINGTQYTIGDAGVLLKDGKPAADMGSLCNFLLPIEDGLLTGGQLGQLFDAQTGKVLYQHHSPLNCGTRFIRDGKPHVAIGSYTGEAIIFTVEGPGALIWLTTLELYENAIKGLVSTQDHLFSVCANTNISWHSIHDFSLIRTVKLAHERIANGCCIAGSNGFASIGRDRKLRLWMGDQKEVYDTPHPNSVKCICANDDGTMLMTGAYTGTLAGFDLTTRSWHSFSRPTAAGISSLTFDSHNRRFLASSYDGQIYAVN